MPFIPVVTWDVSEPDFYLYSEQEVFHTLNEKPNYWINHSCSISSYKKLDQGKQKLGITWQE